MNTTGDSHQGIRETLRRYRIKLRTPRPQSSTTEIHGWLIGRGEDTLRLWHEEVWLADDLYLVQETDVWIFLTAGGEVVTAVALGGSTGSPGRPPRSASNVITADWLFQGLSLPAAVEWCLNSLERYPHLSVSAVLTAVKQARGWLDRAGRSPVFPSRSQRMVPEGEDSYATPATAHGVAEHKRVH